MRIEYQGGKEISFNTLGAIDYCIVVNYAYRVCTF